MKRSHSYSNRYSANARQAKQARTEPDQIERRSNQTAPTGSAQPAQDNNRGPQGPQGPQGPRRRKTSLLVSVFASLFGAGLIIVVAVAGWVVWSVIKPIEPGPQVYEIAAGQGLSQFGEQLVDRGVIEETLTLRVWAKLTGVGRQIKLGRYQLDEQKRLVDVIEKLVQGDVITQQVSLIEGHSFKQFRQSLAEHPNLQHTLAEMTDDEVLAKLGSDQLHPEGLFFPDTYEYVDGTSDFEILERAYLRMNEKLDEAWQKRRPDVPLQSAYEALILASIVEKETGAAEERSRIAGVFVNRLRTGMRLQTDPTVIYGLGESFDGNLTRKHLVTDNEYNTYTRGGLPPTPIANPGAEALLAVVQPADTTAVFFVSRGDGTHQFSETLEQHNEAVDKYQRKRNSKQ